MTTLVLTFLILVAHLTKFPLNPDFLVSALVTMALASGPDPVEFHGQSMVHGHYQRSSFCVCWVAMGDS